MRNKVASPVMLEKVLEYLVANSSTTVSGNRIAASLSGAVQALYLLADETVAEREFGAYKGIQDNYPKYVVSMDKVTSSRDGIMHMNLIDFCLKDKMTF